MIETTIMDYEIAWYFEERRICNQCISAMDNKLKAIVTK